MPFVLDKNELKQRQQGQQPGTPDQIVGGQAATVSGGTSAPSSSVGKTQSGQFNNLSSYLDANKDTGFGNQFADKVEGDVEAGKQAQSDLGNEFQTKVTGATHQRDDGLVGEVKTDAAGVDSDASKKAKFQTDYSGSYDGPNALTDLESYGKASAATQKGAQTGTLAGNEAGQRTLLQQYYDRPQGYTSGQTNLDQFLVRGDSGAQDKLAASGQKASTLAPALENAGLTAQQQAQAAKASNQKLGSDLKTEFEGDGTGGFLGDTQTALKGTTSRGVDSVNKALADAQARPDGGYTNWNVTKTPYYQGDTKAIDYNQTVNKGEASNYSALIDLLNRGDQSAFLDGSKAESFDPNARVSVGTGYQQQLNSNQSAFEDLLKPSKNVAPVGGKALMTGQSASDAAGSTNAYVKAAGTQLLSSLPESLKGESIANILRGEVKASPTDLREAQGKIRAAFGLPVSYAVPNADGSAPPSAGTIRTAF